MNKLTLFLLGVLAGVMLVKFATYIGVSCYVTKFDTVSHNCAQYNQNTSEFEWLGGGK